MGEWHVSNSEELLGLATEFVAHLTSARDRAIVIALSGELGAGKTTFVQGVAERLGVEGIVSSPTFLIEKVYQLQDQKFARLVHIDAYRLKAPEELQLLGWDELVRDPGNLICVEWPEHVRALMPTDAIRIRFDIEGEGRIITIDGKESGQEKS